MTKGIAYEETPLPGLLKNAFNTQGRDDFYL
jgi:hypothetical protein